MKKFSEAYVSQSDWEAMKKKWDDSPIIYCAVISDTDHRVKIIECFDTEMLAADYIVKYINYHHKAEVLRTLKNFGKIEDEFESFYDGEGNRYFLTIDENKDYLKCLEFWNVKIIKSFSRSSPLTIKTFE